MSKFKRPNFKGELKPEDLRRQLYNCLHIYVPLQMYQTEIVDFKEHLEGIRKDYAKHESLDFEKDFEKTVSRLRGQDGNYIPPEL